MAVYGYVRVSTKEQKEDRQLIALENCGMKIDTIYMDKLSGKDFNRPAYLKLQKKLKKQDVLVVKSIDRLGRDYNEIIEQWRKITKEKGSDIVVLDMPLLDTRKGKDLVGTLIADIVLQLLSYVAQAERENTRQRQAEGIAAARGKGIRFGRPKKARPKQFPQLRKLWESGEISAREAARRSGVAVDTFLRWVRTQENETESDGQSGGEMRDM